MTRKNSALSFLRIRRLVGVVAVLSTLTLTPEACANPQVITQCLQEAGAKYAIHPVLLWAIAKNESGFNSRAINRNTNGSYDMGIMQINSGWLPTLNRYGISQAQLFEPCTNIHVGAWILANNVGAHGYTWKAVGAYNAKTPSKQAAYASKILKTANAAIAQQQRLYSGAPDPAMSQHYALSLSGSPLQQRYPITVQ